MQKYEKVHKRKQKTRKIVRFLSVCTIFAVFLPFVGAMKSENIFRAAGSLRRVFMVTGLFGGVQAVSVVASVVRNKCAALFLGPDGVGLLSLLGTLVTMLVQASALGVPLSGVRHLSQAFARGEPWRSRAVLSVRLLSLAGGVVGLLLCGLLGHWLLSPAVLLAVVSGGELAVLKAAHRLRALAVSQTVGVVGSLLLTVPLYACYGVSAVVAVLVLTALVALLPVVWCSWRVFPLRLPQCGALPWTEMRGVLRLGVCFTLAGVVGAASEWGVRQWLRGEAGAETVGLFSAAQMMTVGYMALIFSALEQDYLPRLSATTDGRATAVMVRRQLSVLVALTVPLVLAVVVLLPWLVPLLLSSAFLPAVPLARWWAAAMVLKAATLPVAYLTLARGRSLHFLLLESAYWLVFLLAAVGGWRVSGLSGMGAGIFAAHVFDLLIIHFYARRGLGLRLW